MRIEVKLTRRSVVVQFHKKFVGVTLYGRPSERADTQVCPYGDASLNPN